MLTPGPHTNTPLALLHDPGPAVAVLGLFLLITRLVGPFLAPPVAMGSMTLPLYSTHPPALSAELHYDQPHLWFLAHLAVAALFALVWRRLLGQGPLERLVARTASTTRRLVLAVGRR